MTDVVSLCRQWREAPVFFLTVKIWNMCYAPITRDRKITHLFFGSDFMARKKVSKISPEEKVAAVQACMEGKTNPFQVAKALGTSRGTVYYWIQVYKRDGEAGFYPKDYRSGYSDELKLAAVKDFLEGDKTLAEVCRTHNISGSSLLRDWVEEYNRHGNFYGIWGGKNMTKGTEISFEDRLRIVERYLSDDVSCMDLAREFNVSYQQVRAWTKKYKELGAAGLEDRRGIRTADQTPRTSEEELKVRIAQLEREKYLLTVERDLLKKAREFERGNLYRK